MSLALLLLLMVWSAWQDGDRIEFLDSARGQRVTKVGRIKSEDAVRVVIEAPPGPAMTVPSAALVEIVYDQLPAEVFVARNQERQRNWEAAQAQYQAALQKLPAGPSLLRRHLEFKGAEMQALRAEVGDAAQRTAARAELRRWLGQHGNARQSFRALELLWRLADDEAGKQDAMAELKKLAATAPRDAELARLCDRLEIQWRLREADRFWSAADLAALKKYLSELGPRLAELRRGATGPSAAPLVAWHAVVLAAQGQGDAALAEIDEALTQAAGDRVALAHLYLGRGLVQRLLQQTPEAIWSLLYVDVVYPDDAECRAAALWHLAPLFVKQGQGQRARHYRQRLRTDPALSGTWARHLEQKQPLQP